MPHNNEEQLNALLQSLINSADDRSIVDLLESAHKGFTGGANDFVHQATGKMSPADLKNNLRIYPLAQILISIVKYHELNKNTDIIRKTVLALLDSFDSSVPPGAYDVPALETTLH